MRIIKVDLLKTKITSQNLKDNLPENCLFEATKYKVKNDQYRSLVAWYVLAEALKNYYGIDISENKIQHNEYNKPYIDKIHFNISHSENLVYVFISNNECGIDVQLIGKNNLLKHKDKLLTQEENQQLEMYDKDKQSEFITRIFSKKEAYLKMIGTGVTKEGLCTLVNKDVIDLIITDSANNVYALSIAQKNIDISDIQIMEVYL